MKVFIRIVQLFLLGVFVYSVVVGIMGNPVMLALSPIHLVFIAFNELNLRKYYKSRSDRVDHEEVLRILERQRERNNRW